jgi:demethylmenaquinone methyltransferase/2-methoxy-6-polyprenyl-1,4-benzoquinol methylase
VSGQGSPEAGGTRQRRRGPSGTGAGGAGTGGADPSGPGAGVVAGAGRTARPFSCLWCGRTHRPAAVDDLEARARLCPDCLGRADENPFLRFRLRAGLEAGAGPAAGTSDGVPAAGTSDGVPAAGASDAADEPGPGPGSGRELVEPPITSPEAALVPYYEARAAEYDDWYLRRGRYAHGPIHDLAWQMELDAATSWLDGLPLGGEIVELAAGTGWWSALLATKGELHAYDIAEAPLDRARDRLLAHRLRAHLHVRDAWAGPDRRVDAVFTGFWLSHVPRPRLGEFLALARSWLRPGGRLAAIDSLADPASGTVDRLPSPGPDLSRRRLADGREFVIPKVHYAPADLAGALAGAGFVEVDVRTTGRFFVLLTATAA